MKHDEETIKAAEYYSYVKSPYYSQEHTKLAFLAGHEHGAARKQKEVDELVEVLRKVRNETTAHLLFFERRKEIDELLKKHQP